MSKFSPGEIPKGEAFGQVPLHVALDPDLGPGPLRLFVILCCYANTKGTSCYPSLKKIAKSLGKTERVVRGWVAKLQDAGLIVKTHRKNDTNRYLVIRNPNSRAWARGETFKTQTKPRLEFADHAKRGQAERKKPSTPPEETCTPTGVKNSSSKQTRSTNQFTRPIPSEDLEAQHEHQNRIAQQVGGWEEALKLSEDEQRRLGLLSEGFERVSNG